MEKLVRGIHTFQAEIFRCRDHPFQGTRRTRLPGELRRVDDQRLPGIQVTLHR